MFGPRFKKCWNSPLTFVICLMRVFFTFFMRERGCCIVQEETNVTAHVLSKVVSDLKIENLWMRLQRLILSNNKQT